MSPRYAGIDIGGSKTLVASLDADGVIQKKIKFETPADYDEFLREVSSAVDELGGAAALDFRAAGVGVPGALDRMHGRARAFGNLKWIDVPIQADLEAILLCPVVIENDAKLAGLSEAMMLKDKYSRVLYMTVSTGIGIGLVVDRKIASGVSDGGGRNILVEYRGKLVPWETFASGRAIVRRYGKKAKDIDDEEIWRKIVRNLRVGLVEILAVLQPDVVVVGGSVGRHFSKYGDLLQAEMKKYETPMMQIPPFKAAARPELAVVYGCYDLAKATYGRKRRPASASVSSGAVR